MFADSVVATAALSAGVVAVVASFGISSTGFSSSAGFFGGVRSAFASSVFVGEADGDGLGLGFGVTFGVGFGVGDGAVFGVGDAFGVAVGAASRGA
jgi:hypothetical protein